MKIIEQKRTDTYFDFLCDIVWDEKHNSDYQITLMTQLHMMEYIWLIPNDDNRYEDGLMLRETFIDEGGCERALPVGPCTVLEMLIGLSYRLVFETEMSKWEKTSKEWFWVLIDNLGLDFRGKERDVPPDYEGFIADKINIFLYRRYKFNGVGGLFPLKHPKHDQRKIETWYQMSEYVLENYPI